MKSAFFLLCILICGGALAAQNAPSGSLLVLSKQAHTLNIVDPATLKVVATAPVGDDPHEVIASTDGRTAYVSNYGGGSLHTLAVIDLVSRKALESVDLGALRGPHGLTFAGGKVWFTVEGSKAIGTYDPGVKKVDWIMGTGQNRTHMIYVFADLLHIVTTNVSSGTVSIIDKIELSSPGGAPPGPARTDWNETVIPVGNGSEGFDVSPDGKEIWVANAGDGTISIIDRDAKKVVNTLPADVRGANRLKFTLDGKHVLVSTLRGTDLVILDASTRKIIKRVPIGTGAAGIEMEPGGKRAFVACTPDNYVAVIDLATLEVTGKISNIGQPDGMAWATKP
ncbi:MAG TPA: cytochrome D1 domain-containing protein [Candidatus Acidoferrales bacterium]